MAEQDEEIVAALRRGGTIDITTTGRRSGQPRRIEIVFHHLDGRVYISGLPGRRDWLANVQADPRIMFHLKRGVRADLRARARVISDPDERRPIIEAVTNAWRRQDRFQLFFEQAPLVEVIFDDPTLLAPSADAA